MIPHAKPTRRHLRLTQSFSPFAAAPEGIAVLKPERRRTVPPGYKRLSNSNYFKEYPEATKWIEARDICEREGAHLAIINSEAEGKFVSSLWTNKLFLWAFIGTHDLYEEGNFVTIHSEYTKLNLSYNRLCEGKESQHMTTASHVPGNYVICSHMLHRHSAPSQFTVAS